MKKNLILLVFAFCLQCCGQEKETTYWEIEKIYREDYADKVIANPTAAHQYHIPEAHIKKLRNRYLHYNATNDHLEVVNQPEDDRIRDIIEPSK